MRSAPMAFSNNEELEEQLHDVGSKLLDPPSSVVELLCLLHRLEHCLLRVEQSPTESMQNALSTSLKALIADKLVRHSDYDVKVSVASCITEITRVTAPNNPYDDNQMKVVFQLIVSSFENLYDQSSRLYAKRTSILGTFADIRLCVVMLDLDCDALVLKMFQHFFKAVREDHAENILSSIETITTLVIKESDEISLDLLSLILASVKKDNEVVCPNAKRFGERVLESCAEKLKPYLVQAVTNLGISLHYYSNVLASMCEDTSGSLEQNDSCVSSENMEYEQKPAKKTLNESMQVVEEDAKKGNPSQQVTVDEFKASSSRMMKELRYRNRTCLCNQRASIHISDSDKNPGKLYATCATRRCKYYAWVTPENAERVPEHEMVLMDDRVTKLKVENYQLKQRVEHVEGICERMENFCSVLRNLS